MKSLVDVLAFIVIVLLLISLFGRWQGCDLSVNGRHIVVEWHGLRRLR